ncbi:MAG: hypothetical protein ACE5D2_06020 [Fidelibacterota bacterium]
MRLIFRLLFLILGCSASLQALGSQFLVVPVTARELTIINTPWRNPALGYIAGIRPQIVLSYGHWLAGTRSFAFQYQQGRTVLQLRYLGLKDLELRTTRPTDEPLAKFGAYGTSVEGATSRKWGKLDFGLGLKVLYFQIYTQSSSGIGLDLGLRHRLNENNYVSLSVLNLGQMNTFRERRPVLPRRLIAGMGNTFSFNGYKTETVLNLERSALVDQLILELGNQFFYRNLVISNTFQTVGAVFTYSAGIGIHFGIYSLYYGLRTGRSALGTPQMMDISVRLP